MNLGLVGGRGGAIPLFWVKVEVLWKWVLSSRSSSMTIYLMEYSVHYGGISKIFHE